MKIGDLWIKLGLKKDDFSKGLKEAGQEVSGSGGLLGKLKAFKGGAIAIYAAVAAAAVAMADKFAHTSQRLGDQWDQVTAGLKASWQAFISAVNSTDFSNLGKKLANAFRNAREIAASSDQEFEVMNAIHLKEADMDKELAILRVQMQNQKLSQKERIAAANEYLKAIKPIYDEEERYRKQHVETVRKNYLDLAKLDNNAANQRNLDYFLRNVANNPTLTTALDKYSRNGGKTAGLSNAERRAIMNLRDQQGTGNLQSLASIAEYYQSTSDDQAKELVDAILKAKAAEAAFDKETRRVQQIANQAVTGGTGDKVAERLERDTARAQQRIEDSIEDMMEDVEDDLNEKIEPIKFEPLEIVPPDMKEWDDWYNKYQTDLQRMQDLLKDLSDAAIGGFSDAVQELADQFAGLSDINPGKVISALLTPLADLAIKEGQILVASGLGIEAIKKGLESLNGVAAIAAGAALIAIGSAAKAGLSALANNGASSTSTSTYSGGTGGESVQNLTTELVVRVEGRLSGSDIVLSGQRTVSNWQR